jgi:hypothetical protein
MTGWTASNMSIDTEPIAPASDLRPLALPAGEGQELVVYHSGNTQGELDVSAFYALIAADAAQRAEAGQRIVTMTATATRTAPVLMTMRGTEVVAQLTVAVVYSTSPW